MNDSAPQNVIATPFRVEFPPTNTDIGAPDWSLIADATAKVREYLKSPGGHSNRFRLTFREPVTLVKNSKNRVTTTKTEVKLFVSTAGDLCYTFNRMTGYHLQHVALRLATVENIPFDREKNDALRIARARDIGRKIHPNAWDNIKTELDSNPEYYANRGLNPISIARMFPGHVLDAIEKAFEYRLDYSHSKDGPKRDRRVEIHRCEEGYVKAWFSSEYAGCGNGTYYVLINPTTAAFGEDD